MKRISTVLMLAQLCTNNLLALPKDIMTFFIRDRHNHQIVYHQPLQVYYDGYATISNHHGQIILPHQNKSTSFKLLITEKISPVFSILNNIARFELPNDYNSASLYSIELDLDNKTDTINWLITPLEILNNQPIDKQTIIIFGNPDKIDLKPGLHKINQTQTLILPDLYIDQNNFNNNYAAINIPNSRPFFGKIQTTYTLTPYGYATMQTR